MNVILVVVTVALVAESNGQEGNNNPFAPSIEQDQCVRSYLTNNPDDPRVIAVRENCPNETVLEMEPQRGCAPECLTSIHSIYNGECSYDIEFGEPV